MIKILVISDSHRNFKTIEEIVNLENPNCFIFCGDILKDISNLNFNGQIYAVKGNRDFKSKESSEKVVEINGKRLFITHGDKYNVKGNLNKLKTRVTDLKCDVVCYGHTHKQKLDVINNITYLNAGFAKLGEYAIIEIGDNAVNVKLKNIKK